MPAPTKPSLSATRGWYETQAAAAAQPVLIGLLREARERLGGADPLAARIDAVIRQASPHVQPDTDLVWENYGAGWGWFNADMTGPRP